MPIRWRWLLIVLVLIVLLLFVVRPLAPYVIAWFALFDSWSFQ